MHLILQSSFCAPSILLFYKVYSSRESIQFFLFIPCKMLTVQKGVEIHLIIVLEKLFSYYLEQAPYT